MLIVADAKNSLVNTAFRGLGEVRTLPTKEITRATLKDADVVIVRSETRINADLLEGTSVRFVATATIGTDHVDRDYLDRSGIGFANAPGSNANSVAE
ncbi:MAG: 4-phosphoerythronate dehydrogenase, partial [Bacteroidota bacterium]